MSTRNGKIFRRLLEHNHSGNVTLVKCAKIKAEIRSAAETQSDTPQIIIAECLQGASQSVLATIPKLRHLKQNINHVRKQVVNYPPLPKHR